MDMGIHGLLGAGTPLIMGEWAGRTGLSEPPPMGPGTDLKGWSQSATIDWAALRDYGRACVEATDRYLGTLTDADLEAPLDLTNVGLGPTTTSFMVVALIQNIPLHTGEISCLKGLAGSKGYPM